MQSHTIYVSKKLEDMIPDQDFPDGLAPPGSLDVIRVPIQDCFLARINGKYKWAVRTRDMSKIEYNIEGCKIIYGPPRLHLKITSKNKSKRIRKNNSKFRKHLNLDIIQHHRLEKIRVEAERIWTIYITLLGAANTLENKFVHTRFISQSLAGNKNQTTFIHRYTMDEISLFRQVQEGVIKHGITFDDTDPNLNTDAKRNRSLIRILLLRTLNILDNYMEYLETSFRNVKTDAVYLHPRYAYNDIIPHKVSTLRLDQCPTGMVEAFAIKCNDLPAIIRYGGPNGSFKVPNSIIICRTAKSRWHIFADAYLDFGESLSLTLETVERLKKTCLEIPHL